MRGLYVRLLFSIQSKCISYFRSIEANHVGHLLHNTPTGVTTADSEWRERRIDRSTDELIHLVQASQTNANSQADRVRALLEGERHKGITVAELRATHCADC